MYTPSQLTIRDYFQLAGFGSGLNNNTGTASSGTGSQASQFAQILSARSSTSPQAASRVGPHLSPLDGLSLADYRAQAIYRTPFSPKESVDSGNNAAPIEAKESPKLSTVPERPGVNPRIERSVTRAARKYDLPEELIKGVIKAESGFKTDVVSRAGAQGLMQLMPGTAAELGVTRPFDIDQNIDGGARYLRRMLDRFEGDLKQALAAYNAGPGTVEKYNGDVPYKETRQYVQRVMKFTKQFS